MTHKELIEKHKLTSISTTSDSLFYNISHSLLLVHNITMIGDQFKLWRKTRGYKNGRFVPPGLIISGSVNTINRYLCSIEIKKIRYFDDLKSFRISKQIKI